MPPAKQYICHCAKYCLKDNPNGKSVAKTTYYAHGAHKEPDLPSLPVYAPPPSAGRARSISHFGDIQPLPRSPSPAPIAPPLPNLPNFLLPPSLRPSGPTPSQTLPNGAVSTNLVTDPMARVGSRMSASQGVGRAERAVDGDQDEPNYNFDDSGDLGLRDGGTVSEVGDDEQAVRGTDGEGLREGNGEGEGESELEEDGVEDGDGEPLPDTLEQQQELLRNIPFVTIDNHLRHHSLPRPTRMLFTSAAALRNAGTQIAAINTQLEQTGLLFEDTTGAPMEGHTTILPTALSRLGVNPNDSIKRFIVCPNNECWSLTPYSSLPLLESPVCGKLDIHGAECKEDLYEVVGTRRLRKPFKVMPYTLLSTALAHLLQDKDFVDGLQCWRGDDPDDAVDAEVGLGDAEEIRGTNNTPLKGVSDGSAWRAQASFQERVVEDSGRVVDQALPGFEHHKRHSALRFGLKGIMNIDWFKTNRLKDFSVGGIYLSIANLPRELMFLSRFTTVLGIIPGGSGEPPGTALNRVLEPIMDDIATCERGFFAYVHGQDNRQFIQFRLLFSTSDIPATKKLVGAVGAANSVHPCHYCRCSLQDLNRDDGYLTADFERRDPQEVLDASFRHDRAETEAQRKRIECDHGVRYSVISKGIGIRVDRFSVVDSMHNSFLGLVKALVNWLFENDMFEGQIDGEERVDVFRRVLESAEYPGHLTRLPDRITAQIASKSGGRQVKADEWKIFSMLAPLALWLAWRKQGGMEIDDEDLGVINGHGQEDEEDQEEEEEPHPTPGSRGRKRKRHTGGPSSHKRRHQETTPFRRNRRLWYNVVVSLCAALRGIHSHTITINEAKSATRDFQQACLGARALGAWLTINWHLCLHYIDFIKLYGPLGGQGTYSFERHNGFLSAISHNTKPAEVPTTMMRGWNRQVRLAAVLHNPAPDASATELKALEVLKSQHQGVQGVIVREEARGLAADYRISIPSKLGERGISWRRMNVCGEECNLYGLFLTYVKNRWPEVGFGDAASERNGDGMIPLLFTSQNYKSIPYVLFNGFRFCSPDYSRSSRNQYALALDQKHLPTRCLVKIEKLLLLQVRGRDRQTADCTLAVVRFLQLADMDLQPWAVRAPDLGMRAYYALDRVEDPISIIDVEDLEAPVIVSHIEIEGEKSIVCISLDKEGPEPEYYAQQLEEAGEE